MKSITLLLALAAATGSYALAAPGAFANPSTDSGTAPQTAYQPELVQAALNQFDSALALRDIGQLQAAGVQPISLRRWQKFFKNNPTARVTDNCPASSLIITGDTANWSCTETATVLSEGKPLPFVYIIRFTFIRKNGAWMVSDRR